MGKIVYTGGSGEIIEKKSRFIATVRPVSNENEAALFFTEMKKKYWDARHNCSAFVIGRNPALTRCSDDGEPAGTAGRPMLEVLTGQELTNVAVVVTRYFGGVLLGTGGLVRAYQAAVKEGLASCRILTRIEGYICDVHTDYNDYGKLSYMIASDKYPLTDTLYDAGVTLRVCVPAEEKDAFIKKVCDVTCARAQVETGDLKCFGLDGGELVLL